MGLQDKIFSVQGEASHFLSGEGMLGIVYHRHRILFSRQMLHPFSLVFLFKEANVPPCWKDLGLGPLSIWLQFPVFSPSLLNFFLEQSVSLGRSIANLSLSLSLSLGVSEGRRRHTFYRRSLLRFGDDSSLSKENNEANCPQEQNDQSTQHEMILPIIAFSFLFEQFSRKQVS